MNVSLIVDIMPQLVHGMILTICLTLAAVVIGAAVALPLSLMRASSSAALRYPVLFYTYVFRGTPLLVQLFLIYYGASRIGWVRSSMLWMILRDPIWCALIAFVLNHAAYATEILRGGIRAVPVGEVEAGKAVGMSYMLRTRRLVLPRAIRLVLPMYANEVIMLLKSSSLASTITIMEITGSARKIVAQTFAPYEVFIAAAVIYLGLSFVIMQGFRLVEASFSTSETRSSPLKRCTYPRRFAWIKPRPREARR
ncbi:ABC transporter permease subunit [Neorhizobium sp. NCHU2750]|uniref:ABC transporter permease n=1 Tax=Neorhizobium sp. NCHU2750 TaxID=1825976 RepID=UPI000E767856|nr:octopine/nopaline ABC transporter permease [Neorhizobium sp. NCHU2750]